MDNELLLIAAGLLSVRLALLMAAGYALYHVMRPAPATARVATRRPDERRALAVREDRC